MYTGKAFKTKHTKVQKFMEEYGDEEVFLYRE